MPAKSKSKGLSPAVGVMLIIALTVALVSLTFFVISDFTRDISDRPKITVDTEIENDSLYVNILENDNVEELKVKKNGSEIGSVTDDGGLGSKEFDSLDEGKIHLTAVVGDSEQLIGTVEVNPVNDGSDGGQSEVDIFTGFGSDDKFKGGEMIFDVTNNGDSQVEINKFSIEMGFNQKLDNSDSDELRIREVYQNGLAERDDGFSTDGTKHSLDTNAIVKDGQTAKFELKGFSNTSFELEVVEDEQDADATLQLFFKSGNKQSFFLNQTS